MHKAWAALWLAILQFALPATAATAAETAWPTHPIRLIVPFAPGSFTDIAARAVSAEISSQLGQTFVVENRGGAGSIIGTDQVAKADPDGYTLLFVDNSFAVSAAYYRKLPYDPAKDLTQVALVADTPAVLVCRTGLNIHTLKDLVAQARKTSGGMTFGSGGQGSSAHLAMEAFLLQNGLQMVHVPFKGVAESMIDIAANRVDTGIGSIGSTVQHIQNKRMVGLAISGDHRSASMPDVPTFAEAGFPDYKVRYWFGYMAPARVPAAVVERIAQAVGKALQSDRVKQVFAAAGVDPTITTPARFHALVQSDIAMWKEVIARADIQTQ
ncbi:MAG TPA: tripartite tricarboxylate transporter substrate binding protein [Bordetella sp.]